MYKRQDPERSIIGDHSLCRWLPGSASRSPAGRAAEVARLSSYRTRTSRNVRPMLQSSSRASPMAQPVAGHHPALGCVPGCHGKHTPQPGLQTWFTVIQATRGWLSTLIEGARPSGDHQRSSGKRTEQARYLRAIDAGCRPTRCSSCAPRELVRRRETFGKPDVPAFARHNSPACSPHSATCAECAASKPAKLCGDHRVHGGRDKSAGFIPELNHFKTVRANYGYDRPSV